MNMAAETSLERVCAKLEQIERELTKSPDFQLYLIARSPKHRARMERLLMEIPHFRLWRILINSVRHARPPSREKRWRIGVGKTKRP
jgi:hypothetical protein